MNDQRTFWKWIHPAVATGLALLALAVYAVTLSDGPYPGESAHLVAQAAGLAPQPSPDHPLWFAAARVLRAIPVGTYVGRLNAFSALCGAAAVGLLYLLVSGAVDVAILTAGRGRRRAAAVMSGVGAALALAFATPFWVVSTRAHTAAFDVCLLLVAAWLFCAGARANRRVLLLLSALLYGVGIVEFATFIVLAPLYLLGLMLYLTSQDDLRTGRLVELGLCVLLGLTLYVLAAFLFYRSPAYALHNYRGFFDVIWYMWLNQYRLIVYSLPRVGWLIILVSTTVPWLAALAAARKALNEERDWSFYLLHGIMTVFAVIVVLNLRFAPWPMLGTSRILVTPYVLAASLVGYLAAYWFLVPSAWFAAAEHPAALWLRDRLGPVLAVPLLALVVVAPFRNVAQADGRSAGAVNAYAQEVLASLDGRAWLVTDGTIDDHLAILARERRQPLELLNLALGTDAAYLGGLAERFTQPRLQNAARIGLMPLLQEWMQMDEQVQEKLAVLRTPDLWLGAGFEAVPNRLVFLGRKGREGLDGRALAAAHAAWAGERAAPLAAALRRAPNLAGLGLHLSQHPGLMLNNLGVLLEDLGCREEAYRAYAQARTVDPDNLSALLNQASLVEGGYAAPDAADVRRQIQALKERGQKQQVWSLARTYGYVRAPEAFVQLGMTWALSGQPGMAAGGVRRAMETAPEERRAHLQHLLADIYFLQDDAAGSTALYQEVLAKDPRNVGALIGLARSALRTGDFAAATNALARAEAAGAPHEVTQVERAAALVAKGDLAAARAILQPLTDAQPRNLRAWGLLAAVLHQQGDEFGFEQSLERVRGLAGGSAMAAAVRAQVAWQRSDWESARRHYEEVLRENPSAELALERLLRLDMVQARADAARAHARRLLGVNPRNAFAHYVIGSLQLMDHEYDLAEDSLRNSLATRPSPEALNDLAWLLERKGKLEEAERLARQSVAMNDRVPPSWDTLGVVLMRAGKLTEAGEAFDKSLALAQDNLAVFLHAAELQLLKDNRPKALEYVEMLEPKRSLLAPEDQTKLLELGRKARIGSGK